MSPQRIAYAPSLFSLRALCAFVVVGFHTAPGLVPGGKVGVDVFFVLSGFLISRILLAEQAARGSIDLVNFYLRRAVRLYPALLTFVVAYLALIAVVDEPADYPNQLRAAAGAVTYTMNWVSALGFGPHGAMGALSHTWSLAVEEQFYLVWPIVLGLILARSSNARLWVFGLWVAAILWRFAMAGSGADVERLYNGFDTRADALLVGCFLACVPDASRLHRLAGRTWAVPALGFLAILATPYGKAMGPLPMSAALALAAPLAGWLIVGLRQASPRALAFPPLIYLGRISYGIYLWHLPFSFIVPFHTSLPAWADIAAVFAASAVCAGLSYHFIEQPVQTWAKDRLAGRRGVALAT